VLGSSTRAISPPIPTRCVSSSRSRMQAYLSPTRHRRRMRHRSYVRSASIRSQKSTRSRALTVQPGMTLLDYCDADQCRRASEGELTDDLIVVSQTSLQSRRRRQSVDSHCDASKCRHRESLGHHLEARTYQTAVSLGNLPAPHRFGHPSSSSDVASESSVRAPQHRLDMDGNPKPSRFPVRARLAFTRIESRPRAWWKFCGRVMPRCWCGWFRRPVHGRLPR